MTIPIIFCIDAEPDARVVNRDDAPPWRGYEAACEWARDWRSRIEAATGAPAHFSWFYRLDPQVAQCYGAPYWPLEHYRNELDELIEAGDEIGIHPHAWRWDADTWVADHGNQAWIEECLAMCVDAYHCALGRPPASIRFGDKFYNEASSRRAERLGLQYDLTPEPGTAAADAIVTDGSERFTGKLGDFTHMPQYPYRRSQDDWRRPDRRRSDAMWIIPLSAGAPESAMGRLRRKVLAAFGKQVPAPKPMTLNAARHAGTTALIAEHLLRTRERPYLAYVIRSSDAITPDRRPNIDATLEYLTRHPRAKEFVFVRPDEALAALGLFRGD